MTPFLRRWRVLLIGTIITFLATEVIILLSNKNSVNLQAVRIHHDDSSYGPWLVMRVKNTHLAPIRVMGLGNENEIPWVAYQIERDLRNGSKDSIFNGWCTSDYNIVIPPLSSREIRIPLPDLPKTKPEIVRWDIQLFAESISLLSWISPFSDDELIWGHYSPSDNLPVTGDPWAKEVAERNARKSCCSGTKEDQPAAPRENIIP